MQGQQASGCPTAEEGLRHLLLATEVEKTYQAALGMYDLELAYMVVANSQRDPGEYLLELQAFAGIADANLQRHAIDMHLRQAFLCEGTAGGGEIVGWIPLQ